MSAQTGLLHTWSHLHKAMKANLQRFLASDASDSPNLQHVHLPSLYGRIAERGSYIESALKIRFITRYDDRLPLVIRANADLLRLTVSLMLDYAMYRYPGVGYTTFSVHLTEENKQDYVSFNIWHTGVSKDKSLGIRTWFSQSEMEEFAARMGGYYLAKDQHGTEARYAVRIPLIPGDPSLVERIPLSTLIARRARAKNGITALVVDDNPISRVLGVYLLSALHNITAEAAADGQEALKKLAQKRYDLIFLDHSLPGLNGIQTAALFREKALPRTSIIVGMSHSAGSAKNMKAVFLKAGMQDYLDKPVDPLELNQLLLDLLPLVYRQIASTPKEDADRRTQGDREDTAPSPESAAPSPADSAQKKLVRALSGIAGLDAEKGLANAGGNVQIYVGMLRRFTSELTNYIEPLHSPPADGAWEETALRLRVLQEFFAGIGAANLAQDAANLASMAVAGGGSGYMSHIRDYCDAMMRLRAGLLSLKSQKKAAPRVKQDAKDSASPSNRARTEPADLVKLKRYVSRLQNACLSYRATEAQATVDSLRRMAVHEDLEAPLEAICALVDTLDFHEAQELCAHLLERIKIHRFGAAQA